MFLFRRLPFFPGAFIFIAIGIALANLAGGAGSFIGAIFFLPLLALKVIFFFFIFRGLMHFGGRGRPPFSHVGERPSESRPPTEEEREWAEAKRQAQEEVDRMFPEPQE